MLLLGRLVEMNRTRRVGVASIYFLNDPLPLLPFPNPMAALSPSLPSEHINGTSSSYTSGLAPDVNGSANGTNGTTTGAAPTAFDPELFKSYLLALLPPVIGSTPEELEELFLDEEFEDRVSRFAAEGGSVLYVQKIKEEAEGTLVTTATCSRFGVDLIKATTLLPSFLIASYR